MSRWFDEIKIIDLSIIPCPFFTLPPRVALNSRDRRRRPAVRWGDGHRERHARRDDDRGVGTCGGLLCVPSNIVPAQHTGGPGVYWARPVMGHNEMGHSTTVIVWRPVLLHVQRGEIHLLSHRRHRDRRRGERTPQSLVAHHTPGLQALERALERLCVSRVADQNQA